MIKQFEFYKEDGRWYIDLPEWEGSKDDLEMVLGADALLECLAHKTMDGADYYERTPVLFGDEPFNHADKLVYLEDESEAGWYRNTAFFGPEKIWLCEVTKFVFGDYPKVIYFG